MKKTTVCEKLQNTSKVKGLLQCYWDHVFMKTFEGQMRGKRDNDYDGDDHGKSNGFGWKGEGHQMKGKKSDRDKLLTQNRIHVQREIQVMRMKK
jgi:hypothetical protein